MLPCNNFLVSESLFVPTLDNSSPTYILYSVSNTRKLCFHRLGKSFHRKSKLLLTEYKFIFMLLPFIVYSTFFLCMYCDTLSYFKHGKFLLPLTRQFALLESKYCWPNKKLYSRTMLALNKFVLQPLTSTADSFTPGTWATNPAECSISDSSSRNDRPSAVLTSGTFQESSAELKTRDFRHGLFDAGSKN